MEQYVYHLIIDSFSSPDESENANSWLWQVSQFTMKLDYTTLLFFFFLKSHLIYSHRQVR